MNIFPDSVGIFCVEEQQLDTAGVKLMSGCDIKLLKVSELKLNKPFFF